MLYTDKTGFGRWLMTVLALALLATATLAADEPQANKKGEQLQPRVVLRGAEHGPSVTPVIFDGDVRDLPAPPQWQPGDPVREIPRRAYPRPDSWVEPDYVPGPDPLLELQRAVTHQRITETFTTPNRNFAGQGYTGVNPPDTVGDVGPNHYIQMINGSSGTGVRIWDKAEPTPNELASFILDSLGSGVCASGHGDPIVLYDRFADRWMLSEFANSGNNLCIYISQSSDPVSGGWYGYTYTTPQFPDYPKYGVWPTDANGGGGSYIVTSNESGSGVYALDRAKMLVGDSSAFQRFLIDDLPGFPFNAVTPADLDGPTAPPDLAPAIIMRQRDTENHSGPDAPGDVLEMWTFDVDWVNSANTTFTQETDIDVAEFDSDLCGLSTFYCFPQPGTGTTLDPLREVIMNRLQYMNTDDGEILVGNFVTDVSGADHGGLRWFELNKSGGGSWTLKQEGTYAPDDDHRWMAASAMDQSGNFAIAYNVSSDTTFPSLRYTGRLADDDLGVLTQAESVIHDGTASNSSNRYGDYAAMNIDPEDDCTFWFTGMDNTSSNWRTQVASFRFDACGCELRPDPPATGAATAGDNVIEIDWDDSSMDTIVEYLVRRSRTAGGPYETIAVIPDSSPGTPDGVGYVYADTTVSGSLTYYYVVIASDGEACKSVPTNEANATATGICTLAPLFDGLESVTTPNSGVCTLDLQWSPAAAECVGPISYNVYRSQTPGFTPGPGNLLESGVNNTVLTDMNSLVTDTPYHYVVRAVDLSNGVEETNGVELSGIPQGQLITGTWTDDAGDTGLAQMSMDAPWSIDPTEGNLGPNVYKTGTYDNNECAGLVTPELRPNVGSMLSFWSRYNTENSYDKGEVQVSTDGGLTWERVEMAYPGTSTSSSNGCSPSLPAGDYFTGDDPDWALYTADLSAWANQDLFLRFVFTSDGSQTDAGWWIDDLSITLVGVPATCATGSSCEDNPLVNVEPDGPFLLCEGDEPLLTASLANGTGPYLYQWTRDGVPIPGATASTYQPEGLGERAYNCVVRAQSCPDEVFDGIDSRMTSVNQPFFDGLLSAHDPQASTCTVDLEWVAADSVCAGPLVYFVYRDTAPGVSPTPDNLIISGLTGTSFADTGDLVNLTTYHYLVRAFDYATGNFDDNTVEFSATPVGPGTGISAIYSEDFEDPGSFADWTVSTGPNPHRCGEWVRSSTTTYRPSGGSGSYALTLSDACMPLLPRTSTILDSPLINLDWAGIQSLSLEFDMYYKYFDGGDDATVEIWNGSSWVVIWADQEVDDNGHKSFDITSYAGQSDFRIRFNYQNANSDKWFSVDNVEIIADINNPCTTAVGPVPAPDGRNGTAPLRGDRLTIAGDSIQATWDVSSCTAADYSLMYGDLAGVASHTIDGSVCSIGTSGSVTWGSVPSGDVFFLIVGTDGAGTESSWGVDSFNGERNGSTASGECAVTFKDVSGSCP